MAVLLKASELATIKEILSRYTPGVECLAFGSRVAGRAKLYADLDIVLKSDSALPLDQLAILEEAFIESDLPFKVDIVDWHRITSEFQNHIMQVDSTLLLQ